LPHQTFLRQGTGVPDHPPLFLFCHSLVNLPGRGIPPEEQPRIFNRFYRRLIDEQNMETSGSGLGLPIARQLIELHGGKLWVESVVGEGSTFFVQLPVENSKPK
jgi:signal transduction histidine kinase